MESRRGARSCNVHYHPPRSGRWRAAMVKIFLDTANIDEIREAASWGVLDGVTTNPTLVAKTGRKWSEVIQDIIALVDGPISLEVTTTQADEMGKQGGPQGAPWPSREGLPDHPAPGFQRNPGDPRREGGGEVREPVHRAARRHGPGRHGGHPRDCPDLPELQVRVRGPRRLRAPPPPRDRGREARGGHRHASVRGPEEDDATRPDGRRVGAVPGRLAESPEVGAGGGTTAPGRLRAERIEAGRGSQRVPDRMRSKAVQAGTVSR